MLVAMKLPEFFLRKIFHRDNNKKTANKYVGLYCIMFLNFLLTGNNVLRHAL